MNKWQYGLTDKSLASLDKRYKICDKLGRILLLKQDNSQNSSLASG